MPTERYPQVNLVPFVLEAAGHPGYLAPKFIRTIMQDDDDSPMAVTDTLSAVQTTLHSYLSKQQLKALAT